MVCCGRIFFKAVTSKLFTFEVNGPWGSLVNINSLWHNYLVNRFIFRWFGGNGVVGVVGNNSRVVHLLIVSDSLRHGDAALVRGEVPPLNVDLAQLADDAAVADHHHGSEKVYHSNLYAL